MSLEIDILELEREWATHARWARVVRPYGAADVVRLRGTVQVDPTLARRGAERLWTLLHSPRPVRAPSVLGGNAAVQMVRAGAEAIHVPPGPDADGAGAEESPALPAGDPSWTVSSVVRRIHAFLGWAGHLQASQGAAAAAARPPIVADAATGSAGALDAFETVTRLVEAGAACVRLEDDDCAHADGGPVAKALAPPQAIVDRLVGARLAADVLGAPALLVARTHAPTEHAASRAIAFAPYADVLSFEPSGPDLEEARRFSEAVHAMLPGKLLAYDLSAAFDGPARLGAGAVAALQRELAGMGYRLQIVPREAVSRRVSTADALLPRGLEGIGVRVELREARFGAEERMLRLTRHPREVPPAWLDHVARIVASRPRDVR
ncbi:MAG TPA: isocitrate lyase/phosphoenolpyruvate mutase family protein [Anaeromyxobacter sp.]|nr:isocitrate lyase/phosphoenolpyruvate mutase family protein [Anaeromyxobacter sp.]